MAYHQHELYASTSGSGGPEVPVLAPAACDSVSLRPVLQSFRFVTCGSRCWIPCQWGHRGVCFVLRVMLCHDMANSISYANDNGCQDCTTEASSLFSKSQHACTSQFLKES